IDQSGHRRDIAMQVEWKVLKQNSVDDRGSPKEQQRVSVGRRIDHSLDGNVAAGAWPVFDDDLLTSRSDSHGPIIRATVSAPPPGGNPMIQRTDRDGYACALAMRGTASSAAAPAARCRNCLRRGSFILNLPSRHSITSSARASSVGGTSMSSARAVCRLITNSNLVG